METLIKPLLEVNSLSLKIKEELLFENLDISFNQGELVLLLGPSGAGKSSLMNVLNGLYPNDEVKVDCNYIQMNEKCIHQLSLLERTPYIRSIFQNARLSFAMNTPYEEMIFCLENKMIEDELAQKRIKEQVERYDLSAILHQPFHTLSGGQMQRVAFACAALIEAPFYIMDEPFANIDEDAIPFFMEQIRQLKNQGATILVIDHRLDFWDWADRWLLIDSNSKINELTLPLSSSTIDLLEELGMMSTNNDTTAQIITKKEASPILSLQQASIYLPKQQEPLLTNLNLEVFKGELIALTGPSGSGKTSFFKALLNIYPIKGNYQLDSKIVNKRNSNELFSSYGLVFQDPSLQFIKSSVTEELKFSYPNLDSDSLHHLSEQFTLSHRLNLSPWLLSQGQQRRLACLTMTNNSKKILLIDEPTYGQDYRNAEKIMSTLSTLSQQGVSIIFTTHDSNIVQRFASRQWIVKDKTIQEVSKNV